MRFPEVVEGSTAAARTKLVSSSGSNSIDVCVSSSRTCEAAMSQGTGRAFISVMHILDECSTSKAHSPNPKP